MEFLVKWTVFRERRIGVELRVDGAKYAKMISDKKLMIFVVVARAFYSPDCRDMERLNFQFAQNNIINWNFLIILTLLFGIIYFVSCDNKFAGLRARR